jgi:hypothetical protein
MTAINNPAGKQRPPDKKGSAPKSSAQTSESLPDPDLLAITINVKTGQVVKMEAVNGAGVHVLSDEEKASLAKETGKATLAAIIEQAFEAGIACGLGDASHEDDLRESEKDAKLRHLLLRPLIENSAARRLIRRDVLNRAILKTLIQDTPGSRPEVQE